jgi:tetratricopeptide (TPR) repeat protein
VKKFSVFLLFLLLLSASAFANKEPIDSTISRGVKYIYNIKFHDAEKTFKQLIADYPEHPAGRFFLAMIDWWKILLDIDNESYDDLFFQKVEDVIYQCDELLKKNPKNDEALFFKGGAIGFRGRLRGYRNSWIKAADDGREALPIVEEAYKLNPNNMDVQLGFGIYNYYAAVIPDQYPVVKPLMIFFPKGDKQKGIEQLNKAAWFGKYTKYESRYFLMSLYYEYENDFYSALKFSEQLVKDFPDNPTFERWYGRINARMGDYKKASDIFKDMLDKADKHYNGYNLTRPLREAEYYVAEQYRNERNIDSAIYHFKKSEEYSRKVDKKGDSGFLTNTLLFLGMLTDQKGDHNTAVKYYNEVLEMKDFSGSHWKAEQFIKTPCK